MGRACVRIYIQSDTHIEIQSHVAHGSLINKERWKQMNSFPLRGMEVTLTMSRPVLTRET